MAVRISPHAFQRLAERWHYTRPGAAQRFVENELAGGCRVTESADPSRCVVWTKRAVFVMSDDTVITVLPIGNERELRRAAKRKELRRAYRDLRQSLEDDPYYWRVA